MLLVSIMEYIKVVLYCCSRYDCQVNRLAFCTVKSIWAALPLSFEGICEFILYFFKGFTTDGEFNSLRTNGRKRPISIIEIIKEERKTAKSMKAAVVSKCFQLDTQGISYS